MIQGFDSATQGLTELINFCERPETAENFFHMQGEVNHQKKKLSSEHHQPANSENSKGSNQAAKPSEEDANKK